MYIAITLILSNLSGKIMDKACRLISSEYPGNDVVYDSRVRLYPSKTVTLFVRQGVISANGGVIGFARPDCLLNISNSRPSHLASPAIAAHKRKLLRKEYLHVNMYNLGSLPSCPCRSTLPKRSFCVGYLHHHVTAMGHNFYLHMRHFL